MIGFILARKIFSMFLMIFAGVFLIKAKLVKAEESKTLSVITLYLIMPCTIVSAFQVDYTPEVRNGLLLAVAASAIVNFGMIFLTWLIGKPLRLDSVEKASIIYSNAGNLIIPIVTSVMGPEWVIYSSGFICVQVILIWTHCKMLLCGEKKVELKKIVTNINMIACFIGILMFFTKVKFPYPVQDAVDTMGSMIGPVSMVVTGMLIGSTSWEQISAHRRLWLVVLLRLVGYPLLAVLLLKYSGLAGFVSDGQQILLVTLLATIAPTASSVTQMAQVYGKNADYCSAINVVSTLLCIISMPIMVTLYQL